MFKLIEKIQVIARLKIASPEIGPEKICIEITVAALGSINLISLSSLVPENIILQFPVKPFAFIKSSPG